MTMTLRHLEIFVEVYRRGSITGAAERLNTAQPAVSRSVRELESFYGVRLFERMNRRIFPTEAGEQLFSYADAILSQYSEARDVLSDREHTAKLRIGSNVSCAQELVPGLLEGFAGAYPMVPVCLKVANSQEIERDLLSNELDFGFMDTPRQPESFISTKIREDAMRVVCAKDYRADAHMTFEEFRHQPLLVRESGSGSRQMLEQFFAQEGADPRIVMESSDVGSLLRMCRSGFGMLVIADSMAEKRARGEEFKTVEVCGNRAKRCYCMVHHKSKYLTKSMQYFKEYAGRQF